MLGRDLRLDAAPRAAVARDDDRALHRDAVARELVVVGGDAVVDVDERRGDVAVDRVGVVRRELLGLLVRGRILRRARAPAASRRSASAQTSSTARSIGVGKSTSKRLDVRVEAVALELREDPLGVVLVVRRADVMRARGQPLHRRAHVRGLRDRLELVLPLALGLARGVGESEQGGLRRGSGGDEEGGGGKAGHDAGGGHVHGDVDPEYGRGSDENEPGRGRAPARRADDRS